LRHSVVPYIGTFKSIFFSSKANHHERLSINLGTSDTMVTVEITKLPRDPARLIKK